MTSKVANGASDEGVTEVSGGPEQAKAAVSIDPVWRERIDAVRDVLSEVCAGLLADLERMSHDLPLCGVDWTGEQGTSKIPCVSVVAPYLRLGPCVIRPPEMDAGHSDSAGKA